MNNDDRGAVNMASDERATCGLWDTALPRADRTAALTRVQCLEYGLFDDTGRPRRGVTPEETQETVAVINQLRRALGWLEIDLDGHWRWPAMSDRGARTTGLRSPPRRDGRRRPGSQTRESGSGAGQTPRH